jgi:hypothetical protein
MNFIKIFLFIALVFAAELTVPDGYGEKGDTVDVSVISETQATQLFEEFKSHSEIPYNFPLDGCYARATAMARIAEKEKIQMGKVWVEGVLRAKTKSPIAPEVQWWFHVAPVLYVKTPDGKSELKIFDPSLFDKPVPLKEWLGAMDEPGRPKPKVDEIYYSARFQDKPHKFESKKSSWVRADLTETDKVLEKYSNIVKQFNKGDTQPLQQLLRGAQ